MIGYGLSSKPENYNYSIKNQADIALSLLQYLSILFFPHLLIKCLNDTPPMFLDHTPYIHDFHILAHDYGASVAQELLARKLNKEVGAEDYEIDSVALLNAGLFASIYRPLFIQKVLGHPVLGPYLPLFLLPFFLYFFCSSSFD